MSKDKKQSRRSAEDRIAEQQAVVPDSSKFDMVALPSGPHLVEDFPVLSLVNYLRQKSLFREIRRTVSLVRGPFSLFRNIDDMWGAQAINISALHEASFSAAAYEAKYPEVKAKVDAARAAILAYKAGEQ